jgi:hypothetical protein
LAGPVGCGDVLGRSKDTILPPEVACRLWASSTILRISKLNRGRKPLADNAYFLDYGIMEHCYLSINSSGVQTTGHENPFCTQIA